jgi:hypothetical protein
MHPLRPLVFAALASIAAQPAAALSCAPPAIQDTLAAAEQAPEVYQVVHGSLTPTGSPDPESGDIVMRLTGVELTTDRGPFDAHVLGERNCSGEWCGEPTASQDALVFVRLSAPGALGVVAFDACPFWVFDSPSPDMVQELTWSVWRILHPNDLVQAPPALD